MDSDDSATKLHIVLERVCSVFRSQLRESAVAQDLKLVQLEALIYLSMANRYSDTTGALAEFLGVTKGTASQTVIALERRGLVDKRVDADDGRVIHCIVTPTGQRVVRASHPAPFLQQIEEQSAASRAAVELLRALQAGRDFRTFGQCRTCAYFEQDGSRYRCGLTRERLTRADSLRICREHTITPTE